MPLKHIWSYNKNTYKPNPLTLTLLNRLTDSLINELMEVQFFYKTYVVMTSHQRSTFLQGVRKALRMHLFPGQGAFYSALAEHFLDENNQYHPHLINTPLYNWAKCHVFGGNAVHMLFYLTKVKKENPHV